MTSLARTVKAAAKHVIYRTPPNRINFGSLRRLTPVSNVFGYDRGSPIDRYYIESFLSQHSDSIQGRVLEVGDDSYSRKFGGRKVSHQDVLHVVPGYPGATMPLRFHLQRSTALFSRRRCNICSIRTQLSQR
jgi:hypothetical protein